MSTLVKRLAIGVLLGVLAVFAIVGIKSTLQKPNPNPIPNATATNNTSQPATATNTTTTNTTAPSTTTTPATTTPSTTATIPPAEAPSIVEPDAPQDIATTPDTSLPPPEVQGTPTASTSNTPTPTTQANTTPPVVRPAQTTQTTPPVQNNVPSTTTNSPQMVDIPAPAPVLGKLQLVLIDPTDLEAKPKGNFIITDSQNVQVAMQVNSDVGIFELPPGTYKATVSINGKRNTRTVQIAANQSKLENFTLPPSMSANPPAPTPSTPAVPEQPVVLEGTLQVLVKASGSGEPIRANVYVQKPNGKHIASKTYTTSADFLLEPGNYKITVKAKDKVDLVKDITIAQDKATRATFNMQPVVVNEPVLKPAPEVVNVPTTPNTTIGSSTPTQTQQPPVIAPMPELNKPILEPIVPPLTSSDDPRLQQQRPSTTINSNANVPPVFAPGSEVDTVQNPNEEPQVVNSTAPQMGSLQLHAISGVDGRPLAVDFTVTDLQGNTIRRFNRVAIAEVAVPAQDVLVHIHYEDMNGTETIHVSPGAPTVYTFTVTPDAFDELTN